MKNTLIETFQNKNRPNFFFLWGGWMIYSIISVVENLIRLIALQLYMPNWSMDFIFWHSRYGLELRKHKANNKIDPDKKT